MSLAGLPIMVLNAPFGLLKSWFQMFSQCLLFCSLGYYYTLTAFPDWVVPLCPRMQLDPRDGHAGNKKIGLAVGKRKTSISLETSFGIRREKLLARSKCRCPCYLLQSRKNISNTIYSRRSAYSFWINFARIKGPRYCPFGNVTQVNALFLFGSAKIIVCGKLYPPRHLTATLN